MRRPRPRTLILASIALSLLFVAWSLFDWPPVRHLLRYGLPSSQEPTGATLDIEGVEFVQISPGYFRMGSDALGEEGDLLGFLLGGLGVPWGDPGKASDEMPEHWVEFRRGFWISRHEVTNEQFARFDRSRRSLDGKLPVTGVSCRKAREYCLWLSVRSGRAVRFPTEAEWECACRAGSGSPWSFGEDARVLSLFAWFRDNADGRVQRAGTRRPNAWGLHDLHGNVEEWCEDLWHDWYADAPTDGTAWMDDRTDPVSRVVRGGAVNLNAPFCRSASRRMGRTDGTARSTGLRLALGR